MLNVILVGQLNGHRQICWGAAFLLSCVLGVFCAMIASAVYFALSGGFSPLAATVGFFGPFITVGAGIQIARQLPIEQLTPLGDSAA